MENFNYTKFGLIFWIVGYIMSLIATIPLLFLIQDLFNITDPSTLTDFSGLIAILVLAIVGFIGLVFYLVAYILMCVGGIGYREFGEKHRKFLIISFIIFIILIVLNIVTSVYQMMVVGDAASTGDLSGIVNIYILPIAATIVGGLFYVFILHELEDLKGKVVLYIMLGCTIAIAVITAFFQYSNFDVWAANVAELLSESTVSGSIFGMDLGTQNAQNIINQAIATEAYKYTIYGAIPMVLQFVAMILAFYRIKIGDLKSVPRAISRGRRCSNCGMEIPEYAESCPKCGQFYGAVQTQQSQGILKYCPNCGHKNEESKEFCEECGTKF